jgi:hypothetical protein
MYWGLAAAIGAVSVATWSAREAPVAPSPMAAPAPVASMQDQPASAHVPAAAAPDAVAESVARLLKAARAGLPALDAEAQRIVADSALSKDAKFQIFWSAYLEAGRQGELGRYFVECLAALKPLKDVAPLIEELRASADVWIKRALILVLALSFDHDAPLAADRTGELRNEAILDALRRVIREDVDPVARAAALEFSRIGPPDEAVRILGALHDRGELPLEHYARELVIQLPALADGAAQAALMRAIIALPDGPDAAQQRTIVRRLLVANLQFSPSAMAGLQPPTRELLASFLADPPHVRADANDFDFEGALDYAMWSSVVAGLAAADRRASFDDALLRIAAQASADELAGILLSPVGAQLMDALSDPALQASFRSRLERRLAEARPGGSAYRAIDDAMRVLRR